MQTTSGYMHYTLLTGYGPSSMESLNKKIVTELLQKLLFIELFICQYLVANWEMAGTAVDEKQTMDLVLLQNNIQNRNVYGCTKNNTYWACWQSLKWQTQRQWQFQLILVWNWKNVTGLANFRPSYLPVISWKFVTCYKIISFSTRSQYYISTVYVSTI